MFTKIRKAPILLALIVGIVSAALTTQPAHATVQYTTTHRNTVMNDIVTAAGSTAYVLIMGGTEPANVATADAGTELAALPMSNPIGTVTNGVLTMSAITGEPAVATGTPTHFLLCTTSTVANCVAASSTTRIAQGTIGTSGADMNFATTSIVAAATVNISSWTLTAAGP